ncbi:methyltransferase family protein [Bordetella petrii]|uniref:methyltransferase family protein n=1 Tax=Bordetella petrii TaxID=94624 RepID=UPI001E50C8AD|nr:isoprenylcysteine carboxylmethyltransferase family protein [Bordetella petrii]MCD0505868.1 isoprenylcysteine carboxylmethyltransferase family protein [Bordetella petrii]
MRPTPAIALATLLGTLFYLALAIIGYGGVAAFFAHPARIALALVLFALAITAMFSGGNLNPGEYEDRDNRWVLTAFAIIGLLSGWAPAYTDRHALWVIDGDATRWLGVLLFAAGGTLRLWPVFVLGRRFSGLVAIQPGHELVTTGIYGTIRNPSYLGLLISLLGWALVFRSVVGILLMLCVLPPLIARMRSEEKLLRAHFGVQYEAYRKRTWRLVPWVY